MKILTFGEVLWDVYPDEKHIGGAVMNFSAHASKLGAEVYFASAVGRDEEGRLALKLMNSWGINTDFVAVSEEYETGKCMVTLNENSIPTYDLLQNAAYDHIPCPDVSCDVLSFGSLALRNRENIAVIEKLLEKEYREIFVDINIRPPFYSEETISLCLENATILKISDEELHYVCSIGDLTHAAKDIMQRHKNIKLLIITLGEKGAMVYDGKEFFRKDGIKTEVLSTVGAGDSFSAAFLVNFLKGKSIDECLDAAVKLSSFVVSQQAAVPDYDMIDHSEFLRDTDSDVAVLMIHGIAGTPAQFRKIIGIIPKEWTLHNILLDGHGKGVLDFGRSSMKKWRDQALSEAEKLINAHKKVLIVAHSMGTLFAIRVAISHPNKTCGLFLLSVPTRPWVRFSTMVKSFKIMLGKTGKDTDAMRNGTSIRLEKQPLKYLSWVPRLIELLFEVRRVRALIPQLKVSTKTFQSYTDELVSARSIKDLENHPYIQNTVLYNSGHFDYGYDDAELLRTELKKSIEEIKLGC
ncbi:MAG: hypothetical protein IJ017_02830 [Oscillospiraceae bacterium]|nr:hypothetical protein [Oscillospiraceae bacterium]